MKEKRETKKEEKDGRQSGNHKSNYMLWYQAGGGQFFGVRCLGFFYRIGSRSQPASGQAKDFRKVITKKIYRIIPHKRRKQSFQTSFVK